MRVAGVLFTVALTFFTSIILNYASGTMSLVSLGGILIVFFVFAINLVKFTLWGWLNKKYDLSHTYPLTASFYPLIFIYAIYIGDSVLNVQKVIGLLTIIFGLCLMEYSKGKKA